MHGKDFKRLMTARIYFSVTQGGLAAWRRWASTGLPKVGAQVGWAQALEQSEAVQGRDSVLKAVLTPAQPCIFLIMSIEEYRCLSIPPMLEQLFTFRSPNAYQLLVNVWERKLGVMKSLAGLTHCWGWVRMNMFLCRDQLLLTKHLDHKSWV
jgi:hypothetical protein